MRRIFVPLAMAALSLGACQEGASNGDLRALRTEEVDPPPDAVVDLSEDVQVERRVEALAGVLPPDVPPDLPIFEPATLIDFGAEGGVRQITFTSPEPPASVRADLERRLEAEGWRREGTEDATWFVKEGRRISLTTEPDPVGSVWRIDY